MVRDRGAVRRAESGELAAVRERERAGHGTQQVFRVP